MSNVSIPAPSKPLPFVKDKGDVSEIQNFLSQDLFNYLNIQYNFLYYMWTRTGSYDSNIPTSSVDLNSAKNVGINSTDLLKYTLKSDLLKGTGSFAEINGFGTFAATSNNKRIQLYFGSSLLFDSTSLLLNSGSWNITATVYRASSSSQKATIFVTSDNSSLPTNFSYKNISENLSSDVQIKFVGTGTNNNDIVQEGLIIKIN